MEMTEERDSKFDAEQQKLTRSEQNKKKKRWKTKLNRALVTCGIIFKCLIFLSLEFLKEENVTAIQNIFEKQFL